MSMPSLAQALTVTAQNLGEAAKSALLSRLDFLSLLDQRGRLLQVHTALPALALLPERMVMREAVGQPFELVLDCVSTSAAFELKLLIGEQISLSLLQPDGNHKPWHGYVFEAAQLGSDGGLARYRLVMRPWLSFLAYRRDAYVFQDKTALQIIEDVFADHPQAKYRVEVTDELRVRSLCSQFRESDLEFVARLLAEEGLSYYFEHDAEGDVASASGALHTLVITDRHAQRPDLGNARFAAQHATANVAGQLDAITAFATRRSLQANAVTLGSWNYRQLAGTSAEVSSALGLGDIPALEIYDGSGAYRYQDPAHADRAAELALAALELDVKRFEGQGSTRHFEAGRTFSLIDHPLYGANTTAFDDVGALLASHQRADNQFTLLAVEHHATNNLGAEAAQLLGATDLERGTYKNHFHASPAAAPVVPRFVHKPTAPGAQTALVVGLAGEPLTTDRDHRVKVQFPWQRGASPLAGGLSHEGSPDTEGNAPGDERSGTWVRVAGPSAGPNWGAMFTPRIGTEVLVDFIEGDIDRPIIVGALYNGADGPPFAAGVDSGVNHPGVISGLHTPSLDQSGYNQWVMDDATGQLRMRLLSSATAAELGLGHLIQQGAGTANRGSWRGSGFEANTQAWATLRAAKGVLISAVARAGTYGSAESTQMDAAESVAQLKSARDLASRLSDAAKAGTAHALHSADAGQSVEKFIHAVDPAKDGKHSGSVNGQAALKANGRTLTDPVEAFAKPVIVMDTPSTLAWASDASIASFAGQDVSFTSQGDHHETAAHTHTTVAGETASFYTHAGGIKTFAANGPMSLRAHTDELQILADKDVTVISVNGEIHINAQSKIEIIGADSSIVLDGGDITFTTPGTWAAKASAAAMLGGSSGEASLPVLPSSIVAPEPARKLESTFAWDQLTRAAKSCTPAEFVALVVPIFGFDISAEEYIALHKKLQQGAIPNPKIVVVSGGHYPASFDNESRKIFVHSAAAERAALNDKASWELLMVLLHEFGHYIDAVLRQDMVNGLRHAEKSHVANDAPGDEGAKFAYQIVAFDLRGSSNVAFAHYASPEYSGPLRVNYAAARKAIRAAQDEEAQRQEGKSGSFEHFGAGRGEHAKERPDESFGHASIEDALATADKAFASPAVRKAIYFGNWLRDFSQVLDPKIVRKPSAPKNFPRALSRDALTKIVGILAETEFVDSPGQKELFAVTPQRLGVYRPTEHIDNPTNNDPKAEDPRAIDADFEPLPTAAYTAVDPVSSLKTYISASRDYMRSELNLAVSHGPSSEGYRHFGAALHVLEDYFAHSNFVELSLRKAGHTGVLPWTSRAPGRHAYPVVTGMFDSEDVIASTAGLIADTLFKVQWEFQASKAGERTQSDRLMLVLLSEHSDPTYLKQFENYLWLRDKWASVPGHQYLEMVMHYTLGTVGNLYNFVYNSLLHLMGNSVDDEQVVRTGDPNTNGSTNPSHSQLAKDHDNHPFHTLAVALAKEAVWHVGKAMGARWRGDATVNPADIASQYLVHPEDCAWQDQAVQQWAQRHSSNVKRGESSTEWEALRSAHESEIRAGIDKLGQRSKATWDYINKNYEALFGGKNQVKP